MGKSKAVARTKQAGAWKPFLLGGLLVAGGAMFASKSWGENHENVTVSHGYSFFGDLKYDADFKHLDYVNPNAPKGGYISQWGRSPFNSFNPYTRKGNVAALASIGDENVMVATADDINSSYCLLCETLEYPADISWVIFNLRPNIAYSDGTPATAHDIKYAFEKFMAEGLPSFRSAFGSFVKEIEVLDDLRIKYTFNEDSPLRDRIGLASIIGPLNQKYFEENELSLEDIWRTPPPGTGPYVYDSHRVDQEVVYKRNPDYWGKDLPINVGRNNFDEIRVVYFGDDQLAFEGFKVGSYTFRSENTSRLWGTGYDFEAIENGYVIKEELPDGNKAPGQAFVFNLRKDKFQDIRVREALALMFNFEWSNESLFFDLYARVNGFWDNSTLGAQGVPQGRELEILQAQVDAGNLDASLLTADVVMSAPSGPNQLDRRNLRKASALLDEAGWVVSDDDGLRRKDGKLLEVEFLESSSAWDRIINPYISNLQAIGVSASLNRVDPAQERERLREYDFDMATHVISMPYEPSTGLKQWFSTEAMEGSSRNLMGLSDPAVDALVEVVIAAQTTEELNASVKALDRVLRAKRFAVMQWFKDVHTVAYWDMYEYPEPLPPHALGNLDFWWFNAEKEQALKAAGAL